MDDGELLLRAIRDSPGDDTPRLAYADWLDETATPDNSRQLLAEYIRLSIRREAFTCAKNRHPHPCKSRGPGAASGPFYLCQSLDKRLQEIESLDESMGWNGFLLDASDRHVVANRLDHDPVWRRGFIDELAASDDPADLVRVLDLFARHPVTRLTLSAEGWHAHSEEFMAYPLTQVTLTSWPQPQVKRGRHKDTLTYSVDGVSGEFDLVDDLWPALKRTGKPFALRMNEIVEGVFAIRFPGIKFVLPQWPDELTLTPHRRPPAYPFAW